LLLLHRLLLLRLQLLLLYQGLQHGRQLVDTRGGSRSRRWLNLSLSQGGSRSRR
jgi:hypothetical protein